MTHTAWPSETLEVVMARVNGRSSGALAAADERLTLLASKGIDPHVLDAVRTLWGRGRDQLRRGEPISVPDTGTDRDLARAVVGGPASLAVFPVFDGDELVALLYVDSAEPHACPAKDVERLAKFSRMLARAVRPDAEPDALEAAGWEAYLERTPVPDIERQKLLLLLNRNQWNIARVARLMGVTRRTVYLRLQRYKIPRERVTRTRLRSARPPRASPR
jgi:GAF domain-containing protein